MADPNPHEGTQAMPSGSGPKLPSAGSSGTLPVKIGRYEVRELLGEGAFGRVFLAFDPRLNRPVAIKLPKSEGFTDDMRERFVREAWATATIHHPNVCPVYDVGDEGDVPYIVMHYQPGGTLGGHLDKWKALPPQQAVALAQKLALGMAAAHEKGVIHRDLKPANILYDPAKHLALITDFGLARIGGQAGSTSAGAVFGTPLYMSPEQARGETDAVGPLSDVYALGVILYRMLTGVVPFDGTVYEILIKHNQDAPTPPSVARRGLDKRLDALVLKALAKKPADRYPSAKALADALADYARSADTVAGGWTKSMLPEVGESKSSAAMPATVPPLPPKPAGKSGPPAPPPAPPLPPKPAAKSNPPAPPRVPTVPLPPPRTVVDRPTDDGAIRQKVLLIGGGLLLVLMVVATVAILATSKTEPTAATVEPAPTPPAPTPAPTPAPKKDEPPVEKKDPPKKELPSIANNFAGHAFDAAAERRAAEWALAQGGEVTVTPKGSNTPRPVANAGELPVGEFTVSRLILRNKPVLLEAAMAANLTGLSGPLDVGFFDCPQFGDAVVKVLARVPDLVGLTAVGAAGITDESLAALAKHPKLADLDITSSAVTKAGVKHVATLTALRRLSMRARDTDEWLPDLAPLTELTRLELLAGNANYLTANGLPHLKPFRKLKRLSIFGLNAKDEWVKQILDCGPWPALEELELRDCSIEGPGLAHLKDFPKLDWVSLSGSRVRDAGLEHVAAAPKVAFLYLNSTAISDDGLKLLAKSPGLLQLELQNNKRITDKGLAELAAIKTLSILDLTSADVNDAGAKALHACSGLKKLTLTGTAVTTKGVEELKKALPNCTVIHADAKAPPAPIDAKKLVGKWERQSPTGGKSTFICEFTADGKMTMYSSLSTATPSFRPFTVEGDKIVMDGLKTKDGTGKITYAVTKLTDDELELRYSSGNTYTHKKVPPEKKP